MPGKILDYEAKTIRNEERRKILAETKERAKDMLRDNMDLPPMEKYTYLKIKRPCLRQGRLSFATLRVMEEL